MASNLAKKNNIVNSAAIKKAEKSIDMWRAKSNALRAGITPQSYVAIITDRFPEYYVDDFMVKRLYRVWNGRQYDEDILKHLEIVTEEIKNS